MPGTARGNHDLVFGGPAKSPLREADLILSSPCVGVRDQHTQHLQGVRPDGTEQDSERNMLYLSDGETEAEGWRW